MMTREALESLAAKMEWLSPEAISMAGRVDELKKEVMKMMNSYGSDLYSKVAFCNIVIRELEIIRRDHEADLIGDLIAQGYSRGKAKKIAHRFIGR